MLEKKYLAPYIVMSSLGTNKESKKLPTQLGLESFGIEFNFKRVRFKTELGVYTLSEFKHDNYNMDFDYAFWENFQLAPIQCNGYIYLAQFLPRYPIGLVGGYAIH